MTKIKVLLCAGMLACWSAAASQANAACAVLSFDDGPSPHTTPALLDTLRKYNVSATFFVVGKNVATWPDIVRRMRDEGHEVENHSWNHPKPFEALSKRSVAAQFEKTDVAIAAATGTAPKFVRVPGGSKSGAIAAALGVRPRIDWNVDPEDWKYRNTAHIVNYVLRHMGEGPVVLLHDIHATTVAAVPAIIEGLRRRGYTFVTVQQYRSGACGGVATR